MAEARRCDRCQGFFMTTETEGVMSRIDSVTYYDREVIKDYRCLAQKKGLDLCPDCTTEFGRFMSLQKKYIWR